MATESDTIAPAGRGGRVVLLSTQELRARYAAAATQARLFAELLRLAERVGRRGVGPVTVPVRLKKVRSGRCAS
jgi:hypothetical protein